MKQEKTSMQEIPPRPGIISDKCSGCASCIKICPRYIFKLHEGTAVYADIPGAFCNMCGHCIALCPEGALTDPVFKDMQLPQPELKKLPSPGSLQLLFRGRRSIRAFKKKPISSNDMKKIIEAGRYTATGGNLQNIQYSIIPTPDEVAKFRDSAVPVIMKIFSRLENKFYFKLMSLKTSKHNAQIQKSYIPLLRLYQKRKDNGDDRLYYHAAAIMIVHSVKNAPGAGFSSPAALYNCSLMAHLLGIGCCFHGFTQIAVNQSMEIRKWLGIPESHICHGAMIMGYQDIEFKKLVPRNEANVNWVNLNL